jgi:hypothetical protein
MQAREKVAKPRNTVFFQWFVAINTQTHTHTNTHALWVQWPVSKDAEPSPLETMAQKRCHALSGRPSWVNESRSIQIDEELHSIPIINHDTFLSSLVILSLCQVSRALELEEQDILRPVWQSSTMQCILYYTDRHALDYTVLYTH